MQGLRPCPYPVPSRAPRSRDRQQLADYLAAGEKPREAWRIGTEHEKFGFRTDDLRAAHLRGRARHQAAAGDPGHALRLGSGPRGRQPGGAVARCRLDHAGAGRPAGAFRRAAGNHPRDLPRGELAPGRRALGGRRARPGLPRHGLPAEMAPRRDAVDAQGPLQDHARIHAQGRLARPGHDDPHLHRAGEPGFLQRSGHGEEVPHQPGAAADRHRAVRRLAVHRGQAERLPVLPLAHLDRHRCRPHRHARLRVRRRLRLRALRRLHPRRADVLQLPGWQVHRPGRPGLQDASWPASWLPCPAPAPP